MKATQVELDEACKDAVRIFYGAEGCRIRRIDHVMSIKELIDLTNPFMGEIKQQDQKIKKSAVDINSLNGVSNLTVRKAVDTALAPIYSCGNTEKNETLLRVSRLVGGYVPHYLSYETAFEVLVQAIKSRDIRSLTNAKNTIRTGLKYGMMIPVNISPNQYMSIYDWIGKR